MKQKLSAVLVASAFMLAMPYAGAQEAAGKVLWVKGHAERQTPDGVVRVLAKGDAVAAGDVLRTGPGAHVQLSMSDDALLALRPETTLRVADFRYDGREDGNERAVLELLKGGLRSITGAIGRTNKENLKLRTNTALVGVRGTDHETFHVPEGSGSGTYDRVTVGGTYIDTPQGRVDLSPGQSGFAPLAGAAPARLERTPAFMQLAALRSGSAGPQLREEAPGDEVRLATPRGVPHNEGAIPSGRANLPEQATVPILPAQALGENVDRTGWGKGGRCGGSCADLVRDTTAVRGNGKGNGKGKPF